MDADRLAVEFRQARGDRLAAQQVVERARQHLRVHRVRDESQRQKQGMEWHGSPIFGMRRIYNRSGRARLLIWIKSCASSAPYASLAP